MNPVHHPDENLWLEYVTGQLDPAPRTLLEGHLAFCGTCRVQASGLAEPGAAHFAGNAPAAEVPRGLLESILAKVKPLRPPAVGAEALPLPRSLWPLLQGLEEGKWQGALTPGFRFLRIFENGGPGLFLVHLKAGRPFPMHGHTGLERSLILAGGLRDESGVLEAGDFEETATDRVHSPVALADEDCWLMASLEGSLRFKGWRGLLQKAAGQ